MRPIDGWLQTATGRMFMLAAPSPLEVHIIDIAVALSRIPRFNGHTVQFYSVAQHCVIVSDMLPPQLRFCGLMHDAAEAYVGDRTKPLKEVCQELVVVERRVWAAIAAKFDLPLHTPMDVKHADCVALATEKRDLMAPAPWSWQDLPDPLEAKITPWSCEQAFDEFFKRFLELQPPAV
jgi:uncharacterized protein